MLSKALVGQAAVYEFRKINGPRLSRYLAASEILQILWTRLKVSGIVVSLHNKRVGMIRMIVMLKETMVRIRARLEALLLVIWIGGIWTVGYIVAPVLFSTLDDRSAAALVAGKLFSVMGLVGLYCGTLLLFLLVAEGQRMKAFRPLFMLWLVFEIAGRFSSLPALYIGIVYLVILGGFLSWQLDTRYYRHWQFWAVLGMLLFTAIGNFYLAPEIEAMRQSGEAARASSTFKMLHGAASIFYLLISLTGLALVFAGLPKRIK